MCLLCIGSLNLKAQSDPAFTQYLSNSVVANPAYTGTRDAITFGFSHRQQWIGLDSRIATETFNVQTPINYDAPSYGEYQSGRTAGANMGLGIVSDQMGALKLTNVNIDYAYLFSLNETVRLSLGMRVGFKQFSMNLAGLSWLDPGDPLLDNNRLNQSCGTVGLGAYMFERNSWFFGISAPQLYSTAAISKNVKEELNIHDYVYVYMSAGLIYTMSRDVKLLPSIMTRMASGATFSTEFGVHVILKDQLWLGTSFRYGDAMIFSVLYDVLPGVRVGYSFDYNISSVNNFNNGTHEISIVWDLFPPSYEKRFHCYL